MRASRTVGLSCLLIVLALTASGSAEVRGEVVRATLPNGLRVVVIPDRLAPVVTVEENYLVGADETPPGFPGMAHAQEHMAFRGCAGVSADQIAAIDAQLGGSGNADTQQDITQYFTTVPAADLDVALRMDAACMQDIVDSQAEWAQERGAIEQEVARDLSEPTYKFLTRLNEDLFAGTPYAHDALGTHESFEATTGQMLTAFRRTWYAPNNAILVIAGDVNPPAALEEVKQLYAAIPRRSLPARPNIVLRPVKSETFTIASNLPYVLACIAYRLPGTDSPDYAAARILADVLASQRGDLYGLVPAGHALDAQFELAETYPKASVGFAQVTLPAGADPAEIITSMRAVVAAYLHTGVPSDLVEAAKHTEIAGAEFDRNSIPGLAALWSDALAAEGRTSPDEDVAAIRRVSVDDVNRVARQFLVPAQAVTATLVPAPSGEPVASHGFGGTEHLTAAPTKSVELPEWAAAAFSSVQVPNVHTTWSDTTLANGLRLIVKPDDTSATVTVLGNIRHEPSLQTPPGKEGVDEVLGALFAYGTTHLDRLAFLKALDEIAATESAGYDFSVRVLTPEFSRAVELLADNELHPALPAPAFPILQRQEAQFLAGRATSPGYRAGRTLATRLLPPHDPALREPTPATVSSLTLDDVRRYYARTFRPDLTTIVVIGDVTPQEAKVTIERWFGTWSASGSKPEVTLPRIAPNQPSQVAVSDPTAVQASVVLEEELGVTRFDPDYYALQLGNHVLGGGFYATRLYHDLRQETGYVYTVNDRFTATRTRAVYSVSYGCDPANIDKARDLIARDLRAMQTTDVTAPELRQAKALLLRQMPLQESSEDAVASGLLARAQADLPLDEPARAAKRYLSLTAEQVRTAFAKWIRPDAFVEVVRGPFEH